MSKKKPATLEKRPSLESTNPPVRRVSDAEEAYNRLQASIPPETLERMASAGKDWIFARLPHVYKMAVLSGWKVMQYSNDGIAFTNILSAMGVILSGAVRADGRRWFHLSIAHPHRMPEWEEICAAKKLFLGDDVEAYEVHPTKDNYVNLHPFCRHLWSCVDGNPLPDFTEGTGSI